MDSHPGKRGEREVNCECVHMGLSACVCAHVGIRYIAYSMFFHVQVEMQYLKVPFSYTRDRRFHDILLIDSWRW